jgi:large subunit ribosomal protein L24
LQATLLGISVAIILALVTALVGPHFVDWTQYRVRFETEATRLAGMPVRIAGPIEVSLLPTPTLTLGRVEFGASAQPQGKARELYAELALGALVRGEFRASELRVSGPEVSLGLSANGRLDWPAARMGFDPDQLQIEKVSLEDGRIAFSDGASGTRIALEGFWFKGDLRSLLGPVKGEGGFTAAGERYGYRVSSGRFDDGAMKLKLGLDPVNQPLVIEADGALRFDNSAPQFDGTLNVSRPVVAATAGGRGAVAVPWRASAKVKAEPARALFEQVEYVYGPEASAIRLTGTAEFRFGKNPRIDSLLSARQADLDRALALPEGVRRPPLASLKAFLEPFASSYRPTVPVRLGISVDAVTLAGGTLQSLRGDLKLDGDGWDIETLEMRAPGFAQVRLSGRVAQNADGISFKGPAQVEANEPRMFAAWLEGRSDAPAGPSGVLRVGGDLTVGAQEFAVERLKFEFDRKTVEGRFSYAGASGAKPPRLDAELKAAELDVDGVMAFGRAALDGTAIDWPREVSVAVDVARATVAGIDVKGVSGTFKLDPAGVTFDRVRIADLADAAFSLNGRMEGALDAPRGTVTFDVDARGLDGTVAVLTKFLPRVAEPVRQAAGKITPLKARATLAIEPVSATNPRGDSKVKLAFDGTGGALRMKFNAEAAGDVAALTLPEFRLDGQVAATDGSALTGLLGLDRVLNVDKRAGSLSVAVRSAAGGDATLDARITAGGLSASAIGTARLFSASGLSAALDLTLRSADAGPLRRGAAGSPVTLLPVALSAKLKASPNDFVLEGINGSVGSSPVRGKLRLSLAPAKTIEGQIDSDFLDAGALVAAAAGMPKSTRADAAWSSEPFIESGLGEFSGRIQFSAKRASLTPALTGQQLRGAVRLGGGEIAFEDIQGTLAGGNASGRLVLRRSADGLGMRIKVALAGADAMALWPGEGRPAVSGRLGLSAELEGNGLSPASLVGSLTGAGTIALEDAQIAGLDPRAFSAAVGAADKGMAIDTPRIRDIVATMLEGGALVVPRLDAAFAVNAGQARTGPALIYAQGANLNLLANADLAESTLDARMTLFGPSVSEGTNTTRPEILVTLKGPLAAPKRTVDVAALSAWLMLRSVERQAKHIDAIEAERREFERREAERREAERREAERREAERKETERREAEARAVTSAVPAALPGPAPAIITEERAEPPARIQRPRTTAPRAVEPAAPTLPPPLSIGPAPGANTRSAPRPATAGQGAQIPPPPPRSSLDTLFGLQR